MTLQYVFHKTSVLLYATVLLLAGRPWIAANSDGVLRYLPGAYAVVAGVIVGLIALCALPVVQRLARWLLHFLPDTGRWAERRESWLKQLDLSLIHIWCRGCCCSSCSRLCPSSPSPNF